MQGPCGHKCHQQPHDPPGVCCCLRHWAFAMHPTYRCNPSHMRPTSHPDSRQANPETSANLTSGWVPRYMRRVSEIGAKPRRRSKRSVSSGLSASSGPIHQPLPCRHRRIQSRGSVPWPPHSTQEPSGQLQPTPQGQIQIHQHLGLQLAHHLTDCLCRHGEEFVDHQLGGLVQAIAS